MPNNREPTQQEIHLANLASSGRMTEAQYDAAVDTGIIEPPTWANALKDVIAQHAGRHAPVPRLTPRGRQILAGKSS